MKSYRLLAINTIVIMLLSLTACVQKGDTSSNPIVSETAPASGQASATSTNDTEALILEKLQDHHDVERIYSANKSREEWNTTLDRMISYGAKISEEEKQIIIDYLLSLQP